MQQSSLPGVKIVRPKLANGERATYYYHRATGTRLPADPNSTAFKVALESLNRQVAADKSPPVEVATISTLIRSYQAAPDWKDLAASTREIEHSTSTRSRRRSARCHSRPSSGRAPGPSSSNGATTWPRTRRAPPTRS